MDVWGVAEGIESVVWILYSLLGVQSVAEVVRRGRLRWFGHV